MNVIAHIAVSCAWRMVSKLKVSPFHSVNSPLVEPVRTRRDSGVHCIPVQLVAFWVSKRGAYRYNVHWTSNFICRRVYEFRA